MLLELLEAVLGIAVILGGWIAVQRCSQRSAGRPADADPLDGYFRCHGCTCDGACDNRRPSPPHSTRT